MSQNNKKKPLAVLSGVGLATVMFGTSVAAPYANAAESPNDDGSKKQTDSGSKEDGINVKVNDEKLQDAVKKAKDAGVKVEKEKDTNKTVSAKDASKAKKDIEADYDKQIKALEDATKKAKASDNSDEVKSYNDKVKKEKDAIDKAKSNPSQPKYSEGAGNKFSKSGSWTNLKSKTLDNDVHLASSGTINSLDDLTNGNFKIHAYSDKKGKIKNSNIVQKVSWGNTAPKGKGIVKGDKITEDAQKKVPGYNESLYDTSGKNNPRGKTTQLHSVKAGTWVTIPKAVQLADGSKKDLKVKFTKSGTNLDYGEDWVTFWNEGGAINYYDGSHDINNTPPKDKIKATYRVDDGSNGKNKYLWTGVVLDIDAGQELTIDSKTRAMLGMGGGLKANGDDITTIKSDDNLGKTWGKNKSSNFLDGTKSVPDGTVVFADYAGEISHTLANTGVPTSTLVANGDFGLGVKTSVAKAPEKPKDVNAKYHINNLKVKPTNHKDVENGTVKSDTEKSIDGEEVKVGDTITYPLTNSALPADREKDLTKYEINDEVPKEVEPSEKEIKANLDTKLWDVKVDGQKVTYSATKDLLSQMNKDKAKEFKVPDVPLVGTVKHPTDKEFVNDFTTTLGDKDGDFDVKSNKVKNTTPKKTESKVHKYIIDNGKLVEKSKYKKGEPLNYQGDVEFSNGDAKKRSISDQLDKERLDLEDVKVYMNEDGSSDNNKSNETDSDKSNETSDNEDKSTAKDDTNTNDDSKSKADDKSDDTSKNDTAKDSDKESEDTNKDDANTTDKDKASDDKTATENDTKSFKTGKYTVGKDINAGTYKVTNNDASDGLVVTKNKNGETNTNETIKPNESKEIELKDGEELSVTAGDKDVTFESTKTSDDKKADAKQEAGEEEKSDSKDDVKEADKADDNTSKDDATDSKSEDAKTPFDTKSGKDITDQGTLKLDKDNESFTWEAKDPSKFAGKKVTVVINSKVKKDSTGDIKNVIKLHEDDKTTDSNEVVSTPEKEPKKREGTPTPPKKEDPKTPEKPQPKEQPQPEAQPEKPQPKEQPQPEAQPEKPQPKEQPKSTVQKVDKDLPSTGSDVGDFGILGAILTALGLGSYATYRHNKNKKAE